MWIHDLVCTNSQHGSFSIVLFLSMPVNVTAWQRFGPVMCHWVLPETGRPISCTTEQRVPELQMGSAQLGPHAANAMNLD